MTDNDELKAKLNLETGKISWKELERFFAKGVVIHIGAELDLVDIAAAMAGDDKNAVSTLLEKGQVSKPTLKQAENWHDGEQIFWSVVVAPWVLIQECSE